MSDEFLNENEETEQTAALFVAKQKKKEEEKKAAEEQAERDLKEAEVKRMEAEIAERKKKAAKGKLIAIGVGVVAVIVTLFIVVSLLDAASNIGKVDYAGLSFDAEYTPNADYNKIAIKYPGGFYSEISETEKDSNATFVDFAPEKDTHVSTRAGVECMTTDNGSRNYMRGGIAYTDTNTFINILKNSLKENLDKTVPGAVISDEVEPDLTTGTPEKYCYTCSFTSKEKSGGGGIWLEISDEGVLELVSVLCMGPGDDVAEGNTLRDGFVNANSEDAMLIPGANPPSADAPLDGVLEYPEIDLTMKAPKDLFYMDERPETGLRVYSDTNGAGIMIQRIEVEQGFDNLNVTEESLIEYYENMAKSGIEMLLMNISGRKEGSPGYMQNNAEDFYRTYSFDWCGRTYYEIFYMTTWRDTVNGKDYFLQMEFFAPMENLEPYDLVFANMIHDFGSR
ncbi:hypothetical protein SAMN04487770_13221 [Butyrivibrio sp. ob235]|uniref:hypothetical protein n=1 Tax=Butyrivibrio sp. ob235 TaxID=1761780 RepID=UPI0008D0C114|nr:hypothetical protein [Butyrivibrio sp. ob235]SEM28691.1 hypothetical protein SAMN04487770_13221 [Butyrivibrio sp. ob235]